jgi:hypothetical protein
MISRPTHSRVIKPAAITGRDSTAWRAMAQGGPHQEAMAIPLSGETLTAEARLSHMPPLYRAIAIRDNFSLHHLNCGIAGTVMRGGGGAATLAALPTPLGSTDIFPNAPRVAAFGRAPPAPPDVPFRPRLRLAQLKRRAWPRP